MEISDSGIGIPEADYDHIFERFYRGTNPTLEIGGTDLGLAITRNAILLHRGSVKVASTGGEKGTQLYRKDPTPCKMTWFSAAFYRDYRAGKMIRQRRTVSEVQLPGCKGRTESLNGGSKSNEGYF